MHLDFIILKMVRRKSSSICELRHILAYYLLSPIIVRGSGRRFTVIIGGVRLNILIAAVSLTVFVWGTAAPFNPSPTEAPASFDNRSNGFEEQKDFQEDKDAFDETEEVFPKVRAVTDPQSGVTVKIPVAGGLGPVYNNTSCVACHQNAGFVDKANSGGLFNSENPKGTNFTGSDALSGPASQISELRAGHNDSYEGELVFWEAPGGSLIQQRAIDPRIQESVPDDEDIRTLRITTSTLGDGFVECIDDAKLIAVQAQEPAAVRGIAVFVPVAIDVARNADNSPKVDEHGQPTDFVFIARVGRFGWKCQEASLMNFSAGAYLAEMGITNPLMQRENCSLDDPVIDFDPVADPEDEADLPNGNRFGEDVERFARFMRATKASPRSGDPRLFRPGQLIFKKIGCADCHHETYTTTALERTNDFVTGALGNRVIHPYSDFLLHDIGTGDGIVQSQFADRPPKGLDGNYERLNTLLAGKSEIVPADRSTVDASRARRNPAPTIRMSLDPPIQIRAVRTGGGRILSVGEATRLANLAQPTMDACPTLCFTRQTARLMRTAPLWGLRIRPQLLHDGSALTITDAIRSHREQGDPSRRRFEALSGADKNELLRFLKSL
jgi:CxxC motif-containing protein (DUF1111 family)